MDPLKPSKAQRIAEATGAFEKQRTGRSPRSVTVVLSGETLVVTPHGASPERVLAVTGVEVRETAAEVEPTTGSVVTVFTTGTVVQVSLLATGVRSDTWTGGEAGPPP